jgi:hypothetical protein
MTDPATVPDRQFNDFLMRLEAYRIHRRHARNGGTLSAPLQAYFDDDGALYEAMFETEREHRRND